MACTSLFHTMLRAVIGVNLCLLLVVAASPRTWDEFETPSGLVILDNTRSRSARTFSTLPESLGKEGEKRAESKQKHLPNEVTQDMAKMKWDHDGSQKFLAWALMLSNLYGLDSNGVTSPEEWRRVIMNLKVSPEDPN